MHIYRSNSGGGLEWTIRDSSGSNCLSTSPYSIADYTGAGTWDVYLMSCDIQNSIARVYKNGTSTGSFTFNTGLTPDYASKAVAIGSEAGAASDVFNGELGFFYLNTSYIDFSQESNRNLFVDQLGYPKDLTPAIDAGDIPDPLIYMKFDDTSALGTNSGTGGDFTVNGTVTAGADVDPNA